MLKVLYVVNHVADLMSAVFGIDFHFQNNSASLIRVLIYLLIHLSSCQPISLIIPAVHHFFTLLLQSQNLSFQEILPTLDFFHLLDCLTITVPITLIIV